MYNLRFLAGESVHYSADRLRAMDPRYDSGVNYLIAGNLDDGIYAECPVPDGAAEDYGYMALKTAVLTMAARHNLPADRLHFWFDGQEQNLSADARAECPVFVSISIAHDGEDIFDEAEL